MAFQDFDQISERRRLERKQKLRRRIILGVVVAVLILSAAVVAFLIFLNNTRQDEAEGVDADDVADMDSANNEDANPNKDTSSGGVPGDDDQKIMQSQKAVKTVCLSTDYKETCESHLEKSLSSKPSGIPQPEDLMKAAISAASDELGKAIEQTSKLMKDESTPEKKAIHDVCMQVLEDAQDDFNRSLNAAMDGTSALDLDSWLSAVIAYQQTCIDAIKENATRDSVEQALKTTKELTSNSLAIVSSFDKGAEPPASTDRRLLSQSTDNALPIWMTHETRKLLKADAPTQTPNATVAKDGSGDFSTISKALERLPEKYEGRYIIHIKAAVYEENVIVTRKMVNVTMYGDGSQKTIITGKKNFVDGVPTFQTATFAAIGEGFIAQSIGFRNTAGPEKHQAVALRVQSDRSIFLNCRMEGYQDTLYAQTHRQFYRGCDIIGTIDFIFGDAAAVFQTCEILIRKPMENQKNTVTAQGRSDKRQTTGTVLQKCKITADSSLEREKSKIGSYLGRPWKEFSRTIVMESEIGDVIRSDGWLPWEGSFALKTLYYAEYNNKGPGSDVKNRVKWPGYQRHFKKEEAIKYTVRRFIQGESWLKATKVPVRLGFYS
ncbi:hypothetical protein L2E82_12782 [Cichorium intybus]|uniref:Uncharacterized protein n=1 Tax=Cichorium intybus TaxID=13427 RepID=A0ACB9GHS7_CICIN|nr:hypothetical protein L2E82_12782 [Cichorium intybus]